LADEAADTTSRGAIQQRIPWQIISNLKSLLETGSTVLQDAHK
jgi:hypothetical protein